MRIPYLFQQPLKWENKPWSTTIFIPGPKEHIDSSDSQWGQYCPLGFFQTSVVHWIFIMIGATRKADSFRIQRAQMPCRTWQCHPAKNHPNSLTSLEDPARQTFMKVKTKTVLNCLNLELLFYIELNFKWFTIY